MPQMQAFLWELHTTFSGTPSLSPPGALTTAESLAKFRADRFDQYLTNVTSDGILLIEV